MFVVMESQFFFGLGRESEETAADGADEAATVGGARTVEKVHTCVCVCYETVRHAYYRENRLPMLPIDLAPVSPAGLQL